MNQTRSSLLMCMLRNDQSFLLLNPTYRFTINRVCVCACVYHLSIRWCIFSDIINAADNMSICNGLIDNLIDMCTYQHNRTTPSMLVHECFASAFSMCSIHIMNVAHVSTTYGDIALLFDIILILIIDMKLLPKCTIDMIISTMRRIWGLPLISDIMRSRGMRHADMKDAEETIIEHGCIATRITRPKSTNKTSATISSSSSSSSASFAIPYYSTSSLLLSRAHSLLYPFLMSGNTAQLCSSLASFFASCNIVDGSLPYSRSMTYSTIIVACFHITHRINDVESLRIALDRINIVIDAMMKAKHSLLPYHIANAIVAIWQQRHSNLKEIELTFITKLIIDSDMNNIVIIETMLRSMTEDIAAKFKRQFENRGINMSKERAKSKAKGK